MPQLAPCVGAKIRAGHHVCTASLYQQNSLSSPEPRISVNNELSSLSEPNAPSSAANRLACREDKTRIFCSSLENLILPHPQKVTYKQKPEG